MAIKLHATTWDAMSTGKWKGDTMKNRAHAVQSILAVPENCGQGA